MNVVLTCLLNATPDPQRGAHMPADPALVDELQRSVARHTASDEVQLVVLTDCLDEPGDQRTRFVHVDPGWNPYFYRWHIYAEHLAANAYDLAWCVDATDVEMLNDPFPHMTSTDLYVGSEEATVAIPWMVNNHPSWQWFLHTHADRRLLNAGLLGGYAPAVEEFCKTMAKAWPCPDQTDMAAFNETVYENWPGHTTGPKVHTPFRANQRTGASWWRHK